jgi:hypothetical protein
VAKVLVTGARARSAGRSALVSWRRASMFVQPTSPCRPGTGIGPNEIEDYWQVDLTDAGSAYAVARGCDVVVHTAAIPQPVHNPPHVVFGNNMLSTFNALEAAIAAGRTTVRELLERDGARVHLRAPPVPARLPAGRRGASGAPAGSVRDGEVVRRAPLRPRRRARRHPLHVHPAVLGAGRGELRAEPRARSCATRPC